MRSPNKLRTKNTQPLDCCDTTLARIKPRQNRACVFTILVKNRHSFIQGIIWLLCRKSIIAYGLYFFNKNTSILFSKNVDRKHHLWFLIDSAGKTTMSTIPLRTSQRLLCRCVFFIYKSLLLATLKKTLHLCL